MQRQQQLVMFETASDETPLVQPHRCVRINVRGLPRPQGSIKAMPRRTKTGEFAGIATTYAATTWQWRGQVQQAVMDAHITPPFDGAVRLRLGFDMPRPSTQLLKGRKTLGRVSPSAPPWPVVMPDLDKLIRCVSDAITDAGLWLDDAQVVAIEAAKRYVTTPPGVLITVSTMEAT